MATYTLDGSRIESEAQFWQEYIGVVQPDGADVFGQNLNAFNDALWGGPGWPGEDFTLRILHSEQLANTLGADFMTALKEICADKARAGLELLKSGE
jgi:Barstar (barnase inhibitor)